MNFRAIKKGNPPDQERKPYKLKYAFIALILPKTRGHFNV